MYQRVVRGALVSSPRFRPSNLHRVVLTARGASSPLPSSAMWTSAACVLLLGARLRAPLTPRSTTHAADVAVCRSGRMSMCDAAESDDSDPDDSDPVDWSLLQRRFAQVQTAEAEARVQQMRQTATNWKDGRCEQRVLITLQDWVRKLSVARDLCLCGTHSGVVALSDLESGILLQRWLAPAPGGGSEVTSVGFDGEHIISGDASGGVCLRWWRPTTSLSPPPRSLPRPLCGQHRGAVSGVHWPGGDVACSCPADACPSWEPRLGPGAAAR